MGWGRQGGALPLSELANGLLHGRPPASPQDGVVERCHFTGSHNGGGDLRTCVRVCDALAASDR